jgi:hypothetical protein
MTKHSTLGFSLALLVLGALVSACSSAHSPGPDGGGQPDDGVPEDAGPYVPSCEPMAAAIDLCAVAVCAPVTAAFWDGSVCVPVHCNCTGPECAVYATVAACQAAHASCDAALCTATGGAWFNRPEWCGHFECGVPSSQACDQATPACDCGASRVFGPGVGCVDGPLCEIIATVAPDVLCANTGGEWMLGICAPTTCGRFSDLDCALPACACGELEVFDADRGCIRSPTCEVRLLGEACTTTGLCADSVCCLDGGISADASCVAPLCSDPHGVCGPARP